MSTKVPLVVSLPGSLPEDLNDHIAGFLPPASRVRWYVALGSFGSAGRVSRAAVEACRACLDELCDTVVGAVGVGLRELEDVKAEAASRAFEVKVWQTDETEITKSYGNGIEGYAHTSSFLGTTRWTIGFSFWSDGGWSPNDGGFMVSGGGYVLDEALPGDLAVAALTHAKKIRAVPRLNFVV